MTHIHSTIKSNTKVKFKKIKTQLILEGAHESAYLRQVLAFNAEKFRGSRDPSHAPIWIHFWGSHVRTVPGNTCAKFEVRSINRF